MEQEKTEVQTTDVEAVEGGAYEEGVEDLTETQQAETEDSAENGTKNLTKLQQSEDAEADEHDLIYMPNPATVTKDLADLNRNRRVILKSVTLDDLRHAVLQDLLYGNACDEFNVQFVRDSSGDSMVGFVTLMFSTCKMANDAAEALKTIREDVEIVRSQGGSNETIDQLLEKLKKAHSCSANQVSSRMLIVKNLDAASVTLEKLAALFPDAEDIAVAASPDASNLGMLKGTKHAFLIYKDADTAAAAFAAYSELLPIEFSGRELIISVYKEPPKHIPQGYLRLSTRRLVLKQIARAKGLTVRSQEDPTFAVSEVWNERLKTATTVIDKDDAARDILGLPKPTMLDFKDMNNLKQMPQKQSDAILANLKLAEPVQNLSSGKPVNPPKKRQADDAKGPPSKFIRKLGFSNPGFSRGGGYSGGGRGGMGFGGYGGGRYQDEYQGDYQAGPANPAVSVIAGLRRILERGRTMQNPGGYGGPRMPMQMGMQRMRGGMRGGGGMGGW